jgi:uncharacterized protein
VARSDESEIAKLEGAALVAMISVQAQDTRIAELEKRRASKPGELASRQRELAKQEVACGEIRDLLTGVKKAIDARNLAAETIEQNIIKLDGQLMTLKSNDEFERMKSQIADRRQALSDEQDKALELMMKLDELQEKSAAEEARRQELVALVTKAEDKVKNDLTRLEAEIAESRAKRAETATNIPEALLAVYEEARERGDGIGLAALRTEGNMCGGCFTEVRSQLVGQLMGSTLVQCPYCDRILYIAERLES